MLYAKIVVGLPISGPFDYLVPESLEKGIEIGIRVWVSFGPKKMVGYVVGVAKKSSIKKIKPILQIIDTKPIINQQLLFLAKDISEYYNCSFGEAIESAIPLGLRLGKEIK